MMSATQCSRLRHIVNQALFTHTPLIHAHKHICTHVNTCTCTNSLSHTHSHTFSHTHTSPPAAVRDEGMSLSSLLEMSRWRLILMVRLGRNISDLISSDCVCRLKLSLSEHSYCAKTVPRICTLVIFQYVSTCMYVDLHITFKMRIWKYTHTPKKNIVCCAC